MQDKSKGIITLAIVLLALLIAFPTTARAEGTIIDEWASIKAPKAPEVKPVSVDPNTTAFLILDIQTNSCNKKRRPRCVDSVPKIQSLLKKARAKGMPVVYSITSSKAKKDIREEVFPKGDEPVVKASVNKFFKTDLEKILKEKGVKTVILVGTSAHGAVLHTAVGAAMRKLKIIVPVDGMSAAKAFAEQAVAWFLAKGPGTRNRTTLTTFDMIEIK
ncbi:cysteine hydrolase [Thermodesulfobacteriota bacterium]